MRTIMSMIPQSEEEEEQSSTIACFQKQIKNCRFYCQFLGNRIKCQLIDVFADQYYQVEYYQYNLPQSFTRYVNNINGLYEFISVKAKIFKNPIPGVVMCCQYMGKIEKYIRIEMAKFLPHQETKSCPYFCLLRKISKELFEEVELLKMRLKMRDRQLVFSNNKINQMRKGETMKKVQTELKMTRQRSKKQGLCATEMNSPFILSELALTKRKSIKKKVQVKKQETMMEKPLLINQQVVNNQLTLQKQQDDKEKTQYQIQVEKKLLFEVAKDAPFYSKFKIQQNKIEKINSSQPFELHSRYPILQSKSYFTIYISKTKYKSISIGVFALQYYDQPSKLQKRKFSICYDGYYGIILNQSKQQRSNLTKFREGDLIKTIVDLDQKQIQWSINSTLICKVNISSNLLINQLYPYCEIQDKGDILILNREGNKSP